MFNTSLNISLTAPGDQGDRYFLTLEQEPYETEEIDAEDAANLIDELYGTSICDLASGFVGCGGPEETTVSQEEEEEEEVDLTEEEVAEKLKDLNLISCDSIEDGSYTTTIRVYKSHQEESYRLVIDNGERTSEQPTIVEEEKTLALDVKLSEQEYIEYPVLGIKSLQWEGAVYGRNGRISPPVLSFDNGTIKWEGAATGIIKFIFDTRYDSIEIDAPPLEEDDGAFEDHIILLKAFYHFEVTVLEAQPPPIDESLTPDQLLRICEWGGGEGGTTGEGEGNCYGLERDLKLCWCSGNIKDSDETRNSRSCPEGYPDGSQVGAPRLSIEYVDCGEEDDVHDPEFFKSKCCFPAAELGKDLPQCRTETRIYKGNAAMSPNDIAHYRNMYGSKVKFIPRGARQGYCGEHSKHQQVTQRDCCEGVETIVWDDEESVQVLADYTSGEVFVIGGKAPYSWEVRGDGFYTNSTYTKRDVITNDRSMRVYTENACGTCTIYVTDGCSSTTGIVVAADGVWEEQPEGVYPPGIIAPDTEWPIGTLYRCGLGTTGTRFYGTQMPWRVLQGFCSSGGNDYGRGPTQAEAIADLPPLSVTRQEAVDAATQGSGGIYYPPQHPPYLSLTGVMNLWNQDSPPNWIFNVCGSDYKCDNYAFETITGDWSAQQRVLLVYPNDLLQVWKWVC